MAEEISALGVKLALNLFATPRTPLTHLFKINLDGIRLDIHAIDDMSENPKSAIFLKSIISMAHDLGIEVLADGINTEKQRHLVASLGVNFLMGNDIQDNAGLTEELTPPGWSINRRQL